MYLHYSPIYATIGYDVATVTLGPSDNDWWVPFDYVDCLSREEGSKVIYV